MHIDQVNCGSVVQESVTSTATSVDDETEDIEDNTSEVVPLSSQCKNCLYLKCKYEETLEENKWLKQAGPPGKNILNSSKYQYLRSCFITPVLKSLT